MEPIVDKIQECSNMELERQEIDSQSNVLDIIIDKLSRPSPSSSDCCIFKVHGHLRKVHKMAYEPQIVAIGPYHHGKDRTKMMEEHKWRYLRLLLQRKKENVKIYLAAMSSLVATARKFYAEDLSSLCDSQFTQMMLLDGCFIIELFRKSDMIHLRDENDSIFKLDWIVNSLQRDLMLFENQIPFFVLCELFDMIEVPNQHHRLINLALNFFKDLLPVSKYRESGDRNSSDHLLGLIHSNWLPSLAGNENSADNKGNWRFIYCATGLSEAGVNFEKIEGGSLSDIKFERGKLQIPPLTVDDGTESFLRNMIAYEQYCPDPNIMFVTDYVNFLDWLINTSKDVEILSRSGIIDNWLGDDEVVATMINKILDSTICPTSKYAKIFEQVNFYCSKRRNQWMAKLRRNYLNSPWGVISIVAASVLLLLTATQTFFSVFPRK